MNPGPSGLFPSGAGRAGISVIRSAEEVRAENSLMGREMEVWRPIERTRALHVFRDTGCFYHTQFSLLVPRIPNLLPAPHPVMLTSPFRTFMDILTFQAVRTKQGSS